MPGQPARSAQPVHPRWRGEHQSACPGLPRAGGSSPLARGTHFRNIILKARQRFIPAGAGNTAGRRAQDPGQAVHPRWRGEHGKIISKKDLADGSSPLARGTRDSDRQRRGRPRFIPAGAGNTSCRRPGHRRRSVHPRWRGEHRRGGGHEAGRAGSSPLARGTRGDEVVSRGTAGSSPLARGTQEGRNAPGGHDRFIPAGAGNTCRARPTIRAITVHPRWRGEHERNQHAFTQARGSSPLARGTRQGRSWEG